MKLATLKQLLADGACRRTIVTITRLTDGQQATTDGQPGNHDPLLNDAVQHAVATGKARLELIEKTEFFINPSVPQPRLILIGAVHISQYLAQFAQLLDFDVLVIDPRTAFASKQRFPDVTVRSAWPEDVWPDVDIDRQTAVAALTHDPKIDDQPIIHALTANAFYVGALGSRRTHGKRVARLQSAGVSSERIERIDAPIGLDISAANPAEIALSVMAAIVHAWRQRGNQQVGSGAS